ncbi:hypothetical protein B0T16DRAFT_391661 [Cercophora newfieldiana]|uniref:Uncharacterized protein n=1 Tax=Cercophora newfieldiana TaxID=92897 RepID=A0AA39XZF2_9PEZI|nr:hypothetical protein B0T16DRAFT_391661 [Cercophora newfieldiana]
MWTERRTESASSYPGVLVALEDAHLHSHTYRLRRRPGIAESPDEVTSEDDDSEDVIKVDGEHEGTAMLEMSVPEYSVEGLRREVRRGGKGEKWTDYELGTLGLFVMAGSERMFF